MQRDSVRRGLLSNGREMSFSFSEQYLCAMAEARFGWYNLLGLVYLSIEVPRESAPISTGYNAA